MSSLNITHKKYPFNTAGCLALQREWAQTDKAALWAEAKNIHHNFRPWLVIRFKLSAKQLLWLGANKSASCNSQQLFAAHLQTLQAQLYCSALQIMVCPTLPAIDKVAIKQLTNIIY